MDLINVIRKQLVSRQFQELCYKYSLLMDLLLIDAQSVFPLRDAMIYPESQFAKPESSGNLSEVQDPGAVPHDVPHLGHLWHHRRALGRAGSPSSPSGFHILFPKAG